MGRILKMILTHAAIAVLLGLVLPSSQSQSDNSWTVWDYDHNLIYLSPAAVKRQLSFAVARPPYPRPARARRGARKQYPGRPRSGTPPEEVS